MNSLSKFLRTSLIYHFDDPMWDPMGSYFITIVMHACMQQLHAKLLILIYILQYCCMGSNDRLPKVGIPSFTRSPILP